MSEIHIDPSGFQGQIDLFQAGVEMIASMKYEVEHQAVSLQAVDKYFECIQKYNQTLELFCTLLTQDLQSMKQMKATWMNADSDIATKTFGDILFGK